MAGCTAITGSGSRCKGIPIDSSGLCHAHHPDRAEARKRHGSMGGKRGGRGRPVVELRNIEDKLETLANDVIGGDVEPGVAAVVVQIRNGQIRAISTSLKAREQEEFEARLEALEQQQEGDRRWGA